MAAREMACDLIQASLPSGRPQLPLHAISALMDGTAVQLDAEQLVGFPWMARLQGTYPFGPQPVAGPPRSAAATRSTPLRRSGPIQRKAPMKRTPSRGRPPGTKTKIPTAVRQTVEARSGGHCEAAVVSTCRLKGGHLHHKLMRSAGGPHTVANLSTSARSAMLGFTVTRPWLRSGAC